MTQDPVPEVTRPQLQYSEYYDDEINLLELFGSRWQAKWVILFGAFATALLMAFALTLTGRHTVLPHLLNYQCKRSECVRARC